MRPPPQTRSPPPRDRRCSIGYIEHRRSNGGHGVGGIYIGEALIGVSPCFSRSSDVLLSVVVLASFSLSASKYCKVIAQPGTGVMLWSR